MRATRMRARLLAAGTAVVSAMAGVFVVAAPPAAAAGPLVSFTATSFSGTEGTGSGTTVASYQIKLSSPAPSGGVTVHISAGGCSSSQPKKCATAGVDFLGFADATVNVPAGSTLVALNVGLLKDSVPELTESFTLQVINVSGGSIGAPAAVPFFINDDDNALVAKMHATSVGMVEGGSGGVGQFQIDFNRAVPAGTKLRASAGAPGSATPGDDYAAFVNANLSIPPGISTSVANILIVDDAVVEGQETFTITLADGAPGDTSGIIVDPDFDTTTAVITDNDTAFEVSMHAATFTTTEGDADHVATFQIDFNKPTPAGGIKLKISAIANGTATGGTDFTPFTDAVASVPGGLSATALSVAIKGDTIDEPNETFTVKISPFPGQDGGVVIAGSDTATFTIVDDDPAQVSFASTAVSITEGTGAGTVGVALTVRRFSSPIVPTVVSFHTEAISATSPADFTSVSSSVVLGPGTLSKTITVPVVKDAIDEPDETFRVVLDGAGGGGAGLAPTDTTATVTILDDDAPGALPTVDAGDVVDVEGTASDFIFNVPLTLSIPAPTGGLDVKVHTVDGTAQTGDTDYDGVPGGTLIHVNAGQSSAVVPVTVHGDGFVEPDESFTLVVEADAAYNVGHSPATVTLLNDDGAPTTIEATLAVSPNPVDEGGSVTATVSLSAPAPGPLSVHLQTIAGTATLPDDADQLDQVVSFATGEQTADVSIDTVDDLAVEGAETFTVKLASPSGVLTLGTPNSHVITITDDDGAAELVVEDSVVVEGTGPGSTVLDVPIDLSVPRVDDVTVHVAAASGSATVGTDVTAPAATVVIPAGDTVGHVLVPITRDVLVEGDETFTVTATSVTAPATSPVTISHATGSETIIDDDGAASLSVGDASVVEGTGAGASLLHVPVTLSGPRADTIQVRIATIDGTATSPADYVTPLAAIIVPPGTTSAEVVIAVARDALVEGNEQFRLKVTSIDAPAGSATSVADDTADLTIIDDDGSTPLVSVNDAEVVEGDSGTTNLTFTVTLDRPSGTAVSVDVATAGGTATSGADFTAVSSTLTIPSGDTTKTFSVPVVGDTAVEDDEVLTVHLSNAVGAALGDATGEGTIVDDDVAGPPGDLVVRISGKAIVEGDAGTKLQKFRIRLNKPADHVVTVHYATADESATAGSDYAAASGTVTFNVGERVKTITVAVYGDTRYEGDERYRVSLSAPTGASLDPKRSSVRARIRDDD